MKSRMRISTDLKKSPRPWLVLILYTCTIMINWLYAYLLESNPQIISNSWTVLFPLMSFFYFEFSIIAVIGIYFRTKWGFGLGFITLVTGALLSAMSYLLAFKLDRDLLTYFVVILFVDIAVIVYTISYCKCHQINTD